MAGLSSVSTKRWRHTQRQRRIPSTPTRTLVVPGSTCLPVWPLLSPREVRRTSLEDSEKPKGFLYLGRWRMGRRIWLPVSAIRGLRSAWMKISHVQTGRRPMLGTSERGEAPSGPYRSPGRTGLVLILCCSASSRRGLTKRLCC
jgi:hypothetical protein